MPILTAILAALATLGQLIAKWRKTDAFVIAAAIWAAFLWLCVIIGSRIDSTGSLLTTAHNGAGSSALSGLVNTFNKLQFLFPVYTCFQCLSLYMSLRLSALLLNWLFRIWDAVPFKGGSGS